MFLKNNSRILLGLDPEDAIKIITLNHGRVYYVDPDNIKSYDADEAEIYDLIYEVDKEDKVADAWKQLEHAEEIFAVLRKEFIGEYE